MKSPKNVSKSAKAVHYSDNTCVKFERFSEHSLREPDSSEGVEKTLVIVICHTTAVLDFTDHVANCSPRHTL